MAGLFHQIIKKGGYFLNLHGNCNWKLTLMEFLDPFVAEKYQIWYQILLGSYILKHYIIHMKYEIICDIFLSSQMDVISMYLAYS